jgi:hypothetical protein
MTGVQEGHAHAGESGRAVRSATLPSWMLQPAGGGSSSAAPSAAPAKPTRRARRRSLDAVAALAGGRPVGVATTSSPLASNLYDEGRVADPPATVVQRAASGDDAAFRVLVERYQHMVYGIAATVLGDRGEAEDAAQEVFLRLHRKLGRFKGESAFTTRLLRLAVNAVVD